MTGLRLVGWVERGETHRFRALAVRKKTDGLRFANPSYGITFMVDEGKKFSQMSGTLEQKK
jgi:hypothetical protein